MFDGSVVHVSRRRAPEVWSLLEGEWGREMVRRDGEDLQPVPADYGTFAGGSWR